MVYEISEPTYLTIREDQPLSFSDVFRLKDPLDEIVASYGYELAIVELDLPQAEIAPGTFDQMKADFVRRIKNVSLTSEAAKREFFVAPIMWRLIDYIDDLKVNIELPIHVNDRLKGVIDYLLRVKNRSNIVVIEAKQGELESGFNQLAVEMMAVAEKYPNEDGLYGAVTIGNLWQFGRLRDNIIYKDIGSFRVPEDLEELFSILLGILQEK